MLWWGLEPTTLSSEVIGARLSMHNHSYLNYFTYCRASPCYSTGCCCPCTYSNNQKRPTHRIQFLDYLLILDSLRGTPIFPNPRLQSFRKICGSNLSELFLSLRIVPIPPTEAPILPNFLLRLLSLRFLLLRFLLLSKWKVTFTRLHWTFVIFKGHLFSIPFNFFEQIKILKSSAKKIRRNWSPLTREIR